VCHAIFDDRRKGASDGAFPFKMPRNLSNDIADIIWQRGLRGRDTVTFSG
jgi:hypothetical protein